MSDLGDAGDVGDFEQPDPLHPTIVDKVSLIVVGMMDGASMGLYELLKAWRNDEPEGYEEVMEMGKALRSQGIEAEALAARLVASERVQNYIISEIDSAVHLMYNYQGDDEGDEEENIEDED